MHKPEPTWVLKGPKSAGLSRVNTQRLSKLQLLCLGTFMILRFAAVVANGKIFAIGGDGETGRTCEVRAHMAQALPLCTQLCQTWWIMHALRLTTNKVQSELAISLSFPFWDLSLSLGRVS